MSDETVLWSEWGQLSDWTIHEFIDPAVELVRGFTTPVGISLTAERLVIGLKVATRAGFGRRYAVLYDIRIDAIRRVEVEGWSAERHEFGWRWTTGLMHGGRTVGATTGLTIFTDAGYVVLRLSGPPVAVKPRIEPLLSLVGMAGVEDWACLPPETWSMASAMLRLPARRAWA